MILAYLSAEAVLEVTELCPNALPCPAFVRVQEMIKDGVLEEGVLGPRVDSIYGIHLWSFGKLGHICCSEGPIMAASDKFEIEVKGHGGHGAAPQGTVDAIVEAAALVTSLQTVISRNKVWYNPQRSAALFAYACVISAFVAICFVLEMFLATNPDGCTLRSLPLD